MERAPKKAKTLPDAPLQLKVRTPIDVCFFSIQRANNQSSRGDYNQVEV